LQNLDQSTPIVASQLAGNFTLPKDTNQKLVFIAGGVGITPFRSMIRYLIDTKQPRSVMLLYSNRTEDEILYRDIFDLAEKQLNIHVAYTLTDEARISPTWQGNKGEINEKMIQEEIPDYKERLFYISGSHSLVESIELVLKNIGVGNNQIKKDYFPGLM